MNLNKGIPQLLVSMLPQKTFLTFAFLCYRDRTAGRKTRNR